jgi:hypothetical protein
VRSVKAWTIGTHWRSVFMLDGRAQGQTGNTLDSARRTERHTSTRTYKTTLWQVGDYVTSIRMASYNRVTVVTLVVSYLVRKFPVCYVTRMFITVFRRERHWMVSWASWLQSSSLQSSSLTSIMAVSCYSIQSSPSISCVLHVPRNSQ